MSECGFTAADFTLPAGINKAMMWIPNYIQPSSFKTPIAIYVCPHIMNNRTLTPGVTS